MKAIISIVALAMTFASVLAQELRGGPAVLSDVMPTDAGSEGREWHPKAEFVSDILKKNGKTKLVGVDRKWNHNTGLIADILKKNGKTKLVGKGRKWNHKTGLISDILKTNGKTKLIGKGRKWNHKTKLNSGTHKEDSLMSFPYDNGDDENSPEEDPCKWERVLMNDCINTYYPYDAEKHALCLECLQDAWDEVPVGASCDSLKEIGFCDDVISCEQLCSSGCSAQTDDLIRCAVAQDGCEGTFDSECLSGI